MYKKGLIFTQLFDMVVC